MKADIETYDHGSVIRVEARTRVAKSWIKENVEIPDYARIGASFVGDRRQILDVVEGARANGLVVIGR